MFVHARLNVFQTFTSHELVQATLTELLRSPIHSFEATFQSLPLVLHRIHKVAAKSFAIIEIDDITTNVHVAIILHITSNTGLYPHIYSLVSDRNLINQGCIIICPAQPRSPEM